MRKKITFQSKLIISYSIFMLIMIIFSIVFWGIQLFSSHNLALQERLQLMLQNNNVSINTVFKDLKPVLYPHRYNTDIENFLEQRKDFTSDNISSIENGIIGQHDYVLSMCLFRLTGESYPTDYFNENPVESDWYIQLCQKRHGIPYIGSSEPQLVNNSKKNVLIISKELISTASGRPIGYVLVKIDSQKLFASIDSAISDGFYTLVTTSDNIVIYRSNINNAILNQDISSLSKQKGTLQSFGSSKYYIDSITNAYGNWDIYKIYVTRTSPFSIIFPGLRIFISVSLLLYFVIIIIAVIFSGHLSYNIKLLRSAFQNTASAENLKVIDRRLIKNDEVGILIRSYNHMVERLHIAIEKEYAATIREQRARIEMLNYQINPHFLYNNLNLISSIAILHDVPEITHISKALGDMFHYSIGASDIVTIQDELNNLQSYIELQMIRYPKRFSIIYDIDHSLFNQKCPKFILQPVVENIFSHGFDLTSSNRKIYEITISIRAEDNLLIYNILDDGEGITPSELEKLRANLKQKANQYTEGHIGLWNIQKRIEIQYGSQYGIIVNSQPRIFTQVTICFPLQQKESR
ncbi:MAG: histidine kinase [Eubacteriales bacterium]|nr:histidine kinase [Eubacteriales bacterium]